MAKSSSLVHWREWSEEAFQAAREQDKPILLDIGAVWCHWCHVMDDGIPGDPVHTGTYSDVRVAAIINERYIPIKVDNDRRPDVNARYNMGGWPTTAFLTPQGNTLYGETYITPDRMLGLLDHVSVYYRDSKDDIAERIRAHEAEAAGEPRQIAPGLLTSEIAEYATAAVKGNFDFAFGGFGTQPKFPHTDALAFATLRYAATGDDELRVIVDKTLMAMAGGGMYDTFAGGFFRYSTTRDWSIPHFEKMLEDNALLSKVCLQAARVFNEPRFAEIARDVHGWLMDVMYDPETGTFAGSQDADREDAYYGLPLDRRAALPTPYIDRTIYVNWNALMVSSLIERYRMFQERPILEAAMKTYAYLKHEVYPRHFHADGCAGGEEYLLADITTMLDAALDLAEATGDYNHYYRADADNYGDVLMSRLQDAEQGGFYDFKPSAVALGALSQPKKDMSSSSAAAMALLRLYTLTRTSAYQAAAEAALRAFVGEYRQHSLFSAGYAAAASQALEPQMHIIIVGKTNGEDTAALRSCAWSILSRQALVETRQVEGAGEYPADPEGAAIAYVCVGTVCQAPVKSIDQLTNLLRALSPSQLEMQWNNLRANTVP